MASEPKASTVAKPLTKDQLLKFFQDMLLIRRFEERCTQLYGMGLIGGFCHLYIGQEAVVVGIQSVLNPQDSVITAYRDHGHMLACGMNPKGVMAELTGREGGLSKGKGGSMHMFSKEKNFYGGHGIVGAQIPLGTGLAFAHQYKNDQGLNVAYMGDGAANQGQVYEAFNMAALWKLPIIYVIENNQYGMGTSVSRHAATPDLYKRGEPYGIPGYRINGMDIMAVREAALMAAEHVRSGKGPILLEMETYRYRGHSMSDPGKYRSKDEVDGMKNRHDPIDSLKELLMTTYQIAEQAFELIEDQVKAVVLEAVEFAKDSPEPGEAELYTDVLKDEIILPFGQSTATVAIVPPQSSSNAIISW